MSISFKILKGISFSFAVLVVFLFMPMVSKGQNEKFKALFIYNFTKHILWPEQTTKGSFNIDVLGSSAIIDELKIIAGKKSVNGQLIRIRKITTVRQIENTHLLFIPRYNGSKLTDAVEMIKKHPTVVITDDYGLASKGAGINLVWVDNSQDYQIFRSNIQKNGIKVSPKLFELGIVLP